MDTGLLRPDPNLYRRGQFLSSLSRGISVGLALSVLVLFWWNQIRHPLPALGVGLAYILFAVVAGLRLRRKPRNRPLKIAHDLVDAIAVGLGSAFSGGLESPLWLLLYPHVVAVSIRGGLGYALLMGVLDSAILFVLTALTPAHPLGALHALGLLFCAFMGGTASSYLHEVQGHLEKANRDLEDKNRQLEGAIAAHEAVRAEEQLVLAQLRASEERYPRLLERIQDGVLIIQDGRVVFANEAFARMAGQSSAEIRGIDFLDLVPPEDRDEIAGRYQRWQQSQAVSGLLESRVRSRTGETHQVSLRAGSVEYEGKRSIIATVRDITRERQMEGEVRAHAESLSALNEIANAVNLSLTIEDIFLVAAEETRRLVPCDRITIALLDDDGSGVEVVALDPGVRRHRAPFTQAEIAWAYRRPTAWCHGGEEPPPHLVQGLLAERGVQALATVPLQSKDRAIGSLNLGRLSAQAFSKEELTTLVSVARHIAIALDNARLLEAVRKRSNEFESLLEIGRGIVERLDLEELLPLVTRSVNRVMGTPQCILLLKSGNRLEVAAQEGFEPEVIEATRGLKVGESLSGWVAREGRPLALLEMKDDPRLMVAEHVRRFGYRSFLCVPLKRGTEVLGTLEVVTREPRRFGAEQQELMAAFAAFAAVAIDNARLFEEARTHLDELGEANRRLAELDRLRQQYLRNVSHEFRTPLTIIKGYSEYLEETAPEDGSLRDVSRILVESADRVIDMVDTLLEVSRIEQGAAEQNLRLQQLDFRDLVTRAIEPLRVVADGKKIRFDLELPAEPLQVEGDANLLYQVVRKLLDNALKYSGAETRIVVRGLPSEDGLAFEVEDRGIGIPAEHLSQIFDKFYMVDGGIARRVGGTGVGLYLVREIVKLHRGSVDVSSTPGRGSTFRVRLPRTLPSSRAETALA